MDTLATRHTVSGSAAQRGPPRPQGGADMQTDLALGRPQQPLFALCPVTVGSSGHLFPEVPANTLSQLRSQPAGK